MDVLKKFQESNAWDNTHNLPLVPSHNNPHIYLAYATKIYREAGASVLFPGTIDYIKKCTIIPGLFNRWPDGKGGVMSHDELIGICYLDPKCAGDILFYLTTHDGIYNNSDQDDGTERYNLNRFPWFITYVKACAGFSVGLFSQILYSLNLIKDAHGKNNPDGRLMLWLMNERMFQYSLCSIAIHYWRRKMMGKGFSVAGWLASHLPNHLVFAELSAETEV